MSTDFDKQLYNNIARDFNARVSADKKLQILEKRITLGRGTQADVAKLSERLGQHAGAAMVNGFKTATPDATVFFGTAENVIRPVMENIHGRINTAAIIEQAMEDARAGLKISLVKGGDGAIGTMISDVTAANDGLAIMENEAITTARKFYDDFQIENVAERAMMGYEMYVTREYDDVGLHGKGEVCQFCKERAGTFDYPTGANDADVFARHPGCGCTITFTTDKGTMTQTDWKHNQWS